MVMHRQEKESSRDRRYFRSKTRAKLHMAHALRPLLPVLAKGTSALLPSTRYKSRSSTLLPSSRQVATRLFRNRCSSSLSHDLNCNLTCLFPRHYSLLPKVGEISDVVYTDSGCHIIKRTA